MSTRKKKKKEPPIDGLGPKDIKKLRTAIRQVWQWSHARRLCVARCTDSKGFARCELCREKVAKIYPDHIEPCGELDGGYIARMFVPSSKLQGLCKKCHDRKTAQERRAAKISVKDF